MSRRSRARLLWLALLIWACVILWLSSLSPRELPQAAFVFWDKLNHFLAFSLGGWLAANALRASRPALGGSAVVVAAVFIIAAFGLVDEMLQTITPGRTGGDVYDWTADVLGALTGALLSRYRLSFRRNLKERQ